MKSLARRILLGSMLLTACDDAKPETEPAPAASASVAASASAAAPDPAAASASAPAPVVLPERPDDFALIEPATPPCPPEMVRVKKSYCVDRYEASLIDTETAQDLSPYYVPSRKHALSIQKLWEQERLAVGPAEAREMALPPLPPWQSQRNFEPKAVSKKSRIPQGYLTGPLAALACKNAGKRLCSLSEWQTACRGEDDRNFPYGDTYEQSKCNIFREAHPAGLLHGNPSIGHSDPRLNTVKAGDKPLLRRTGETRACTSRWEGDGIADMVGNIDEWIDDPEGTFVGGFYARSKKDGCASMVRAHPFDYFDYSTGVRCCKDL
ncbi:MAG TPA: SUMF1/EgtB/PvdO family nonheme iron enzyme [Polyangium sp.]|nr:SUMF1/EgtB/PvdO family nonheme iron enzyme [Polyangium sp.]